MTPLDDVCTLVRAYHPDAVLAVERVNGREFYVVRVHGESHACALDLSTCAARLRKKIQERKQVSA